MVTALVNAPGRLYDMGTLSVCSRERRASPKVTHNVGTIMTKKLGQAFQGLQVQDRVLVAPSQWSEIPYPQNQLSKG